MRRAIDNGDLPTETQATAFHTFLLGISIQARDGVSRRALGEAIDELMVIWDSAASR